MKALNSLPGDLAGTYYSLSDLGTAEAALVENHFLFKQGDRFMEAAGSNRHWPGMFPFVNVFETLSVSLTSPVR